MNTTLPTAASRLDHPPHQSHPHEIRFGGRVRLLDRLALRLGIALITWGRRAYVVESRERRAMRFEQQLAQIERERIHERNLRLSLPPR